MACGSFKLRFVLPSWIKGKKKENTFHSQDYVYLNWQFKKSCLDQLDNEHKEETASQKIEGTKLEDLPGQSKFENVHSWLESQDLPLYNSCSQDSECDCCESEDIHYACVDVTNSEFQMTNEFHNHLSKLSFSSRHNSETSLLSNEHHFSLDNSLSEESSYSLQLREQSRTLFRSL